MRRCVSFSVATMIAASSWISSAPCSRGSDLEQEYAQVRKIALKDPKVQEAYEKADERLDAKILQIDPSLKPIVDRKKGMPVVAAAGGPGRRAAAAPTQEGREHVVVKGETLSSIAGQYRVKVAALEKVNHITDGRKLQVGRRLIIPGARAEQVETESKTAPSPSMETEQAKPAAESGDAPPKDGGIWDRLKNSL